MIINRKELAKKALFKAMQLRKKYDYELWEPICIYDFVEKCDVEIRFEKFPSMEGMYSKLPRPVIVLGSERPSGRLFFNCAHEFGHHVFNHGFKIDKLIEGDKAKNDYDPKEFLVDCFAGFLLLPQIAIQHAFKMRDWDYKKPTPIQLYTIAGNFGVGYSTLITHMNRSLKILNSSVAEELIKIRPKNIKSEILGDGCTSNLIIADQHWKKRPIDIQVGDLIITPSHTVHIGKHVELIKESEKSNIFKGYSPGIGRFKNVKYSWDSFFRVSRREYVGLSKYRHLEEVDDEVYI